MCVHTVSLHKKETTLQNKHTSPNFETIRRLIKQKAQEKFSQEAIASSNKTRWKNIKTTWENNRKEAVVIQPVTSHYTYGHNIQPSSHSTFMTVGNNSAGSF
jgi:hypothetical protein